MTTKAMETEIDDVANRVANVLWSRSWRWIAGGIGTALTISIALTASAVGLRSDVDRLKSDVKSVQKDISQTRDEYNAWRSDVNSDRATAKQLLERLDRAVDRLEVR